ARILEVSCAPRFAAVVAAKYRVAVRRVGAGAGAEGIDGQGVRVGPARILEVSCAPRFAAVVAAKYRVAVRRVEAGAGAEGIDGQGFRVGREQLLILGNGTIGPLVRFFGVGIEAGTHRGFPRLAPVARTVESALENSVVALTANGAIKHDHLLRRIRAAGETLNLLPRQPLRFIRPRSPVVVGSPDAFVCGCEHRVSLAGAIEVEREHLPGRPRTRGPRFARITREPAAAFARPGQNDFWIQWIDGNLSGQRIREIADGCERPAPVMADLEPPPRGGINDVRICRVKSRAASRVATKLRVVDHAPVATA